MATVKNSSTRFRCAAAPLLEEERDSFGQALIADSCHPFVHGRPSMVARLSADDYPIDPIKVEMAYRPEQRLNRQELCDCRGLAKVVKPEPIS